IAMDTVDPRRAGYAPPGDPLRLFVGGHLAAESSVGAEGITERLNLDPPAMRARPRVIVPDASIIDSHAQARVVNFPGNLSATSAQVAHVAGRTVNGTATAGASCRAGVDFVTDDGVAPVAPGQLSTTIPVLICGDTPVEPDETFPVAVTRVV